MELNRRVDELEAEFKVVKNEVQAVLLDIRERVLSHYDNPFQVIEASAPAASRGGGESVMGAIGAGESEKKSVETADAGSKSEGEKKMEDDVNSKLKALADELEAQKKANLPGQGQQPTMPGVPDSPFGMPGQQPGFGPEQPGQGMMPGQQFAPQGMPGVMQAGGPAPMGLPQQQAPGAPLPGPRAGAGREPAGRGAADRGSPPAARPGRRPPGEREGPRAGRDEGRRDLRRKGKEDEEREEDREDTRDEAKKDPRRASRGEGREDGRKDARREAGEEADKDRHPPREADRVRADGPSVEPAGAPPLQQAQVEPVQQINLMTLIGLVRWVERSVKKIGKERVEAIVEIYRTAGYLPSSCKDIIPQVIRLADDERPEGAVTMGDSISVLLQLDSLLGGKFRTEAAVLATLFDEEGGYPWTKQ